MIGGLLLLQTASASTLGQTFCIEIPTNYVDIVEWADFYTFNTDRAVRGVKIEVVDNFGVESKFAEWSGGDAGCATFFLDENTVYMVRASAEARVDGRQLRALQAVSNQVPTVLLGYWTGTFTLGPTTYQVPADETWHALTMAGNIFARYDYNVSTSFMFNLKPGFPPSPTTNVHWDASTQRVFTGYRNVLQMSHNIGYAIGVARDEGLEPVYGASTSDGCHGSGSDSAAHD